jgi:predicted nucleic acid-binding protein
MGYLLDTNVISEIRRPRPHPDVVDFVARQALDDLYLSVVSLAEIRFGIEQVTDAARRRDLQQWLTHSLRPMFEGRLLPVSEEVMLTWRILLENGRKQGLTYAQPDLIIAATAQQYGLTVVTRDQPHFETIGVPVLNPWKPPN